VTPSSSDMVVLAEANMLGRICGTGIDGAGTQLRVLLRTNPQPDIGPVAAAMQAGFDTSCRWWLSVDGVINLRTGG
jgi:hypothetical protein